jgi:hypothetical protein
MLRQKVFGFAAQICIFAVAKQLPNLEKPNELCSYAAVGLLLCGFFAQSRNFARRGVLDPLFLLSTMPLIDKRIRSEERKKSG